MRLVIGCLAVGGCFAFGVMVVNSMPSIPSGLTKSAVEQRYQDSLSLVRRSIEAGQLTALRDDPRVLAIYRTTGTTAQDLYLRDPGMNKTGHRLWNGAGVAVMTEGAQEVTCVAYDLTLGGVDYLVVLRRSPQVIPEAGSSRANTRATPWRCVLMQHPLGCFQASIGHILRR